MTIKVKWDNVEQTIIYYTFEGAWSFKEFNDVYADVYQMLDTVDHTVHAIVDLRASNLFPRDTLTEMRRLTFEQHENGGITVIITERTMAHSMYNFLKAIYKRFSEVFHLVKTPEAAYQRIHQEETGISEATTFTVL